MRTQSTVFLVLCVFTLGSALSVGAQGKPKLPRGLDPDAIFIPDDNPMTPEKIALGKKFFWDKRWSVSSTTRSLNGSKSRQECRPRHQRHPPARHSPLLGSKAS
jgi:hypothetical protein